MKRTTIYLDDNLRKEVQKLCIDLGISMTDFIRQALLEKLEREGK